MKKPVCPKCGGENVVSSEVDERLMFECSDCAALWYSQRGWSNPAYLILDDIIEAVQSGRPCEVAWPVLRAVPFRQQVSAEGEYGPSPEEQLRAWTARNKLQFSWLENWTKVRFYRRPPT